MSRRGLWLAGAIIQPHAHRQMSGIVNIGAAAPGSVAVTVAAQHAEERGPRADLVANLVGHGAGDLVEVGEVVRRPGSEELAQRHRSEHRAGAAALEAGGGDVPAAEGLEVPLP